MDTKLLGLRIKTARELRGLTIDQLASAIQVNKSTISRYERGEIQTPKCPVIHSIANVLHVHPSWLSGKIDSASYTPPNSSFQLFAPNNLFSPLKNMRLSRNLSLEETALALGISKENYAAIENGHNTDCVTLALIADFFCCSTDFILAHEGVFCEDDQISFSRFVLPRLHHSFKQLSTTSQEAVIAFAEKLLTEESNGYEPDSSTLETAQKLATSYNTASFSTKEINAILKFRQLDERAKAFILDMLEHQYAASTSCNTLLPLYTESSQHSNLRIADPVILPTSSNDDPPPDNTEK